jgi:hypothetical protein
MKEEIKLNNSFCCAGFQNHISDAGHRGIAVLAVATSEGVRFRLQSRGIDFEDENKFRPIQEFPEIKINVSCMTGLKYCPFCGCRLQDLVKASPKVFEDLVEKHRQFRSEL